MKKNIAALCTGLEEMEIGEVAMPEVGDDDVLVDVAYCGICGSDASWYQHGEQVVKLPDLYPYVLGHEFSGTVIETGKNVKNLKIGDRVSVEPGKSCGKCRWCMSGKYNLCNDMKFLSAPPEMGAMRRYVAHPERLCFKLPDNVSTKSGALIEPFSVGLHAVELSEVTPAKDVLIFGAGTIGLVTLMAAKMFNAKRIFVVDLFDEKLEIAKKFGADEVINSKTEKVEEKVLELTDGQGVDIAFDATGTRICTQMTAGIVARGGIITLVGCSHEQIPFDFYRIQEREIQIKTIFRYRNDYPIAIGALATGKVNLEQLVTAEFPIEEAKKAFDTAVYDRQNNIKVMVKIHD